MLLHPCYSTIIQLSFPSAFKKKIMGRVKFRDRSIFLGICILYIYFSLCLSVVFFLSIKPELQEFNFFFFTLQLCQDNLKNLTLQSTVS